jgi:nucleoside-diphosphate-sugar epimerase
VRGDLTAGSDLGLAAADREELRREVTDVLHCAAATRFTLPLEEARTVNVGGTRALLEFLTGCRSVRRVGCFSTVYVAGRRIGRFAEDDLDDGGAGFVNTYEQSKNEMEREVRDRMADLPLAVYRLSTLAGESATGAVTGYNAFHDALRLLYHGLAPMVPGEARSPVDLAAVDYVADAACWLFRNRFEAGRTYHLCSGPEASCTLEELIDAVVEAFHRYRPQWRRRSIEKPAIVNLPTYELFVQSVEETGNEVLRSATRAVQSFAYQLAYPKTFDTARTRSALEGSGLRPHPVVEYLPKVVRACIETGWGATPE